MSTIDDSEQFFEDLAKLYPELMEKSTISEYIGVDKGWFSIINILFECIYSKLHHAKHRLAAAALYPRDDDGAFLDITTQEVADEIAALPILVQIKEKFGTLRVYVHNSTDRVEALIDFAEGMSAVTCEVCGKPGKLDSTHGWVKTHCVDHMRHDANDLPGNDGTILAIITDDN